MSGHLRAVFDDVVRLEIELWNAVELRLRNEHDLELTWFEVICTVARSEPATVGEISRELNITVGGASKLVDRIESAGYLRRSPNPADGRSSLVQVTAAGRQVVRQAEPAVDDELESILGGALSEHAWNDFARSIRAIRTALTRPVEHDDRRTA